MKILAKTTSLLFILLAGGPGLLGQNTLLVHHIQPLLAYSSDIQDEIELSAEPAAGGYQFYMEAKIQLEEWMIEPSEWKDGSAAVPVSALMAETESEMPLEGWMIRPFSSVSRETWDFLMETTEEPIEVRKWMICCTDWNIETRQTGWLKIPEITIK